MSDAQAFSVKARKQLRYKPSVDVYSYGIFMFELLSHSIPWGGLDQQELFARVSAGERPSVEAAIAAEAPAGWVAMMRRCLSHDPRSRPQLASELTQLQSMLVHAGDASSEKEGNVTFVGHECGTPYTAAQPNTLVTEELLDGAILAL